MATKKKNSPQRSPKAPRKVREDKLKTLEPAEEAEPAERNRIRGRNALSESTPLGNPVGCTSFDNPFSPVPPRLEPSVINRTGPAKQDLCWLCLLCWLEASFPPIAGLVLSVLLSAASAITAVKSFSGASRRHQTSVTPPAAGELFRRWAAGRPNRSSALARIRLRSGARWSGLREDIRVRTLPATKGLAQGGAPAQCATTTRLSAVS